MAEPNGLKSETPPLAGILARMFYKTLKIMNNLLYFEVKTPGACSISANFSLCYTDRHQDVPGAGFERYSISVGQ
jgi:hypothetical protein